MYAAYPEPKVHAISEWNIIKSEQIKDCPEKLKFILDLIHEFDNSDCIKINVHYILSIFNSYATHIPTNNDSKPSAHSESEWYPIAKFPMFKNTILYHSKNNRQYFKFKLHSAKEYTLIYYPADKICFTEVIS